MKIPEETRKKIKKIANLLTEGDDNTIKGIIRELIILGSSDKITFKNFILESVSCKNSLSGSLSNLTKDELTDLFDKEKSKLDWQDLNFYLILAIFNELDEKNIKINLLPAGE